MPAAATAAAPPAVTPPPSIMVANRQYCPLCKLWCASTGHLLEHCKETEHSAKCLYFLRRKHFVKCFVCNQLMLEPVEDHLISKLHAINWYRFIVDEVQLDCNAYNYVRVAQSRGRPDSLVWRTLRFDAVADQLYSQHLQMHRGYYFPLHDDYVEEEVDESEVEEVS